ncbi:polysaccharide deacetylase family protein [Nocardia blacklockiae]|uniref:polysaccharide deacetylase family protein n=1 Tax=Nocardia blacklockiae TaxID=480036 RepID=UPI002B4B0D6B|nr:polysaccharide deacetylase family protein [Nocardia blacklockiae]
MSDGGLSRRQLLATGVALTAGLVATGCGAAQGNSTTAEAVRVGLPTVGARQPQPAVAGHYAGRQPAAWGTDIPGIVTSVPGGGKRIALTFDACGGPDNNDINTELLNLLNSQLIPATLFLNKRWIEADPARAARLAANPLFELANHGTRHCPLSVNGRAAYGIAGTGSPQQVVDEVWGNHETLTSLVGHPPRFFRTGTAHYDDVAVAIVRELGEQPVGFSVNADAGATYSAAQVEKAMSAARPGAIAIAHMHRPKSGTAAGMSAVLPRLRSQGYEFVKLP